MVEIYDSKQKKFVSEGQFGGDFLRFLYNTTLGRFFLKIVFLQSWFWDSSAFLQNRPSTIARVNEYVEKYSIVKNDYVNSDWRSFNDFFNRQFKPGVIKFSSVARDVISIAEGKLLTVSITDDATIEMKHRKYDLASIVGSVELANQYEGGIALVYRLSVHNYHRYLFPDGGGIISTKKFKGVLHTISSISNNYPVYSINQREVSVLSTHNFDEIVMVEVGAMMAGKIVNNSVAEFERGQEKGRFEIGGSTVLVLYKKDTIVLNDDIQTYSEKGVEVTVTIGEGIGKHV